MSAVEAHLARLKIARESKLLVDGTLSAQRAAAERRAAAMRVDRRIQEGAAKRRVELQRTYTTAAKPPSPAARTNRGGGGGGLVVSDELLGEGATGKVWAATFGPNKIEVAAKVVRKDALTREQLGWIREEIHIHKQMRHPHICTLHGYIEDGHSITMVLALCRGGSLCDTMGRALSTNSPLPEEKCHHAFVQLCGALHYCHRTGVVHRDIKLYNLVWADQKETRLVLVDFGYAATVNEQHNFAGSPHYAAPEVHRANDDGTPDFLAAGADVWSCGVCLFAMLATQLPFGGEEETDEEQAELRKKVCDGSWDCDLEGKCSEAAADLVTRMLTVNPEERASLDDVCEHEWVGGLEAVPWQESS